MANNQIPEVLKDFRAYKDGTKGLFGYADVGLPGFEAMTETLSGAGVGGEIEVPVVGKFGSQTVTINFRTLFGSATDLASMRNAHSLTFRGAVQVSNRVTGNVEDVGIVISLTMRTKNFSLGNLESGTMMDTSIEGEVLKIRVRVNNVETIELDKLNDVYKVNGVDENKPTNDLL